MHILNKLDDILNEIKFQISMDKDHPSKGEGVILFDPKDDYIIYGYTHGLESHAIKHLKDFSEKDFNDKIEKVKNILKDLKFYILINNEKKEGNVSNINIGILLNTLDRINDKVENKKELTIEEKKINSILREIAEKYSELIEKRILNFNKVDMDKKKFIKNKEEMRDILKNNVIVFTGMYRDALLKYYWRNPSKLLVVEKDGYIRTALKYDEKYYYKNQTGYNSNNHDLVNFIKIKRIQLIENPKLINFLNDAR